MDNWSDLPGESVQGVDFSDDPLDTEDTITQPCLPPPSKLPQEASRSQMSTESIFGVALTSFAWK